MLKKFPAKLILILIFLGFLGANLVTAAEIEEKEPTANKLDRPVELTYKNSEIIHNLDLAKDSVAKNAYALAISKLVISINQLKENQKKTISSFFPKTFGSFKIVSSSLPRSGEYFGDSINMVFSQKMVNSQGFSIDMNVLFMDPAISEYVNIIDSISKEPTAKNIDVITIKNKYQALRKIVDDSNYYELNIIVNKDTLLNIIVNGINQPELISTFCNQIDIIKLDKYLTK